MRVNIKPLSVNSAWQGKRFKTNDYLNYEKELLFTLPKMKIPDAPLSILFKVGYSNPLSDIDNFVKPFLDILQKKYLFNDCQVYEMNIKKYIVKKGCEFIDFEIQTMIL